MRFSITILAVCVASMIIQTPAQMDICPDGEYYDTVLQNCTAVNGTGPCVSNEVWCGCDFGFEPADDNITCIQMNVTDPCVSNDVWCGCAFGFEPADDNITCIQMNGTGPCVSNEVWCGCDFGFEPADDNITCIQMNVTDPCVSNDVWCGCAFGFEPADDNITCIQMNGTGPCVSNEVWCGCDFGFEPADDNITCIQMNVTDPCVSNDVWCGCAFGFEPADDNITCIQMNGTGPCVSNEVWCGCDFGFEPADDNITCIQMNVTDPCVSNDVWCGCAFGFEPADDNITCIQMNVTDPCVSNDVWCGCAFGFEPADDNITCIQSFASSCDSNEFICGCDENHIPDETDSSCKPVLRSSCEYCDLCDLFPNMVCGTAGTCECKAGFYENGTACIPVLGMDCVNDVACQFVGGDFFQCNNGLCDCQTGFHEDNGHCIPDHCQGNVDFIPDRYRRSINYAAPKPAISDGPSMVNQWLNIGLATVATADPGMGKCGALYPIYMDGELTPNQLSTMQTGTVTVTAKISGLDSIAPQNQIDLSLRQCGPDTHVQFKSAPPRHMAALCVGDSTMPSVNDMDTPVTVASLNFTQVMGEDGILYDEPFVQFSCNVNAASTSGRYYTVSWYLDDNFLVSFKGLGAQNIHESIITDKEIQQHHGPFMNQRLRCSVEYCQTSLQERCRPKFSDELFLGVREGYRSVFDQGTNGTILQLYSGMPLGCKERVGSTNKNCTLSFKPAHDAVCLAGATGINQHDMCGAALIGVTKSGYNDLLYSYVSTQVPFVLQYGYDALTYFGPHIIMPARHPDGTDIDGSSIFAVEFGEPTESTGHIAWDSYELSTLKMLPVDANDLTYAEDSAIRVMPDPYTGNPMINKTFRVVTEGMPPSTTERILEINTNGTYLLMRSPTRPFEVQVVIEDCNDSENGVCICAFLIRDGNDVYVDGNCDGVDGVTGLVHGSGDTFHKSFILSDGSPRMYRALNGIALTGDNPRMEFYDVVAEGGETFDGIEGIASFTNDPVYPMRDGSSASDNSAFITEWKANEGEDLLNPANHNSFRWTQSYYRCGCPDANTDVPESVTQELSPFYSLKKVYTGVVECEMQETCTHIGQETGDRWEPLNGADYSINEVWVTANLSWNINEPSTHLQCHFTNVVEGYKYKVGWLVSEEIMKETGIITGQEAQGVAGFYKETDINSFNLESQVQCKVSVYDGVTNELLIDGVRSSVFIPVTVQNPEVEIGIGHSAYILLRKRVPFACSIGNNNCCQRHLVSDTTDTGACDNSSITVRSSSLCGKQATHIQDTSQTYAEDEDILIQIVTKNNDFYELKTEFTLTLRSVTCDGQGRLWNHVFSVRIRVTVIEQNSAKGRFCSFNNDPRVTTFDLLRFPFQRTGVFIAYLHGNTEIQIETETCNPGGSCVCGVAVRAGRQYCAYNFCGRNKMLWWKNKDVQRVLKCYKRGNFLKAKLPHGTWVYAEIFRWRKAINLNIFATLNDFNNVTGLCGNFNGDLTDEWVKRDGSSLTSASSMYVEAPAEFTDAWRVTGEPGDIDIMRASDDDLNTLYEPWDSDLNNCVCYGPQYTVPTCAADEDDTCLAGRKRRAADAGDIPLDTLPAVDVNNSPAATVDPDPVTDNPDAMSETDARQKCITMLAECRVYNEPGTEDIVEKDGILQDCTQDHMLNGSIDWKLSYCGQFQVTVTVAVQKNKTLQQTAPALVQTTIDVSCPGSCSDRGTCINGQCQCNQGFSSEDCSVERSKRVTQQEPEQKVYARGTTCITINVDDSSPLATDGVCSITKRTITGNDATGTETTQVVPLEVILDTVGRCCFSGSSRRRRSVTQGGVNLGDQTLIAVSNDGSTFSDPITVYSVDTNCLNITVDSNGGFLATVVSGYCVIDGTCYTDATQNPTDVCQHCISNTYVYGWTQDNITASCQAVATSSGDGAEDEDGMSGGVIAAIVVSTLIGVGGAVAAAVVVYLKVYKPKMVRPAGGLFDGPSKDKFTLRKETTMDTPKDKMWYESTGPEMIPGTPTMPEDVQK